MSEPTNTNQLLQEIYAISNKSSISSLINEAIPSIINKIKENTTCKKEHGVINLLIKDSKELTLNEYNKAHLFNKFCNYIVTKQPQLIYILIEQVNNPKGFKYNYNLSNALLNYKGKLTKTQCRRVVTGIVKNANASNKQAIKDKNKNSITFRGITTYLNNYEKQYFNAVSLVNKCASTNHLKQFITHNLIKEALIQQEREKDNIRQITLHNSTCEYIYKKFKKFQNNKNILQGVEHILRRGNINTWIKFLNKHSFTTLPILKYTHTIEMYVEAQKLGITFPINSKYIVECMFVYKNADCTYVNQLPTNYKKEIVNDIEHQLCQHLGVKLTEINEDNIQRIEKKINTFTKEFIMSFKTVKFNNKHIQKIVNKKIKEFI